MNTLFTFGYASRSMDEIISLLEEKQAILADIRSSPRSRKPGFNRYALAGSLRDKYRHLPALGNVNYRNPDLPIFLRDEDLGLEGLARLLEKSNVVIMCGCKNLEKCHRLVVAEKMEAMYNVNVVHLTADE